MIQIFYTRFNKPISTEIWNSFFQHLPLDVLKRAQTYRRWEDQHAFVLGRLLLMEAFNKIGLKKNAISEIKYNKFGKPFLNDSVDFNISHSGQFVICAIGEGLKLGIDIQTIVDVDFSDFKDVMTSEEWKNILTSDCPKKTFFRLWTIKESVIKAETRGLSIPLSDIIIKNNEAEYLDRIWFFKELNLDDSIFLCLTSNIKVSELCFYNIDYYSRF